MIRFDISISMYLSITSAAVEQKQQLVTIVYKFVYIGLDVVNRSLTFHRISRGSAAMWWPTMTMRWITVRCPKRMTASLFRTAAITLRRGFVSTDVSWSSWFKVGMTSAPVIGPIEVKKKDLPRFFIPYERSFTLVLWNFGSSWPRLSKIADFQLIIIINVDV